MSENTFDLSHLYNLRQNFIIIGLTGRRCSGCTTFSDIMQKEKFEDCNFPEPNNEVRANINERKYRIAYNFLKKNWKPFYIINYCEVISLLVYKEKLNGFIDLLSKTLIDFDSRFTELEDFAEEFSQIEILKKSMEFKDLSKFNDKELFEFFDSKEFNDFHIAFQDALKTKNEVNRALILHTISNNIRDGGCYYCESDSQQNGIYKISEQIKQIIKGKRHLNENIPCNIIIDSIKNPLEIMYFRERYSSFYTLAFNPEDEVKNKDMIEKFGRFAEQIKILDKIEYGDKNKRTDFYKQDVQKCIEKSDLHISFINNPEIYPFNFKQQVVIFYSLMLQPGLITPTDQERCMQIAYSTKYNSGCISRQVGAIITDEFYSLKSIGWNDVPEGQISCLLRSSDELLDENKRSNDLGVFSNYEKDTSENFFNEFQSKYSNLNKEKLKGHNSSFCFKDIQNSITEGKNQVHTKSLHAEENAIMQIAKYGGQALKNGILFTTASPCELCAKKAYQVGITRIFYIDPYLGISISQILNCGEIRPTTHLFTGAIGRAYNKLYESFMPYKDELYIRTGLVIKNKLSQLEEKNLSLKEENERLKELLKNEQ